MKPNPGFRHRLGVTGKLVVGLVVVVALAWGTTAVTFAFAPVIDTMFGDLIQRAIRFRTYQPAQFVCSRVFEFALMVSILCSLTAGFSAIYRILVNRFSRVVRLAVLSLSGFLMVNVFLSLAMQLCSFWLVLFAMKRDYHMPSTISEHLMLAESNADMKGILIGSSQLAAQVDAMDLNLDLGPKIQFASLAYKGIEPTDMVMLHNRLQFQPDVLVCYVSEINFCRGIQQWRVIPMWSEKSKSEFQELEILQHFSELSRRYGAIANALPMFRIRRGVETAFFGEPSPLFVTNKSRSEKELGQWMAQLDADFINLYDMGEPFTAQCRAFDLFLQKLADDDVRVFVISGHISDVMALRCSPKLQHRAEVNRFLKRMDHKYDNMTLIHEGRELPKPAIDQYRDFLHLAEEHRPWYTRHLAEYLAGELGLEIRPQPPYEKPIEGNAKSSSFQ